MGCHRKFQIQNKLVANILIICKNAKLLQFNIEIMQNIETNYTFVLFFYQYSKFEIFNCH